VTDGCRFIYVLGSQFPAAQTSVEKYDAEADQWYELPNLIEGGKNLSCCYFRNGMNEETLWCLHEGRLL